MVIVSVMFDFVFYRLYLFYERREKGRDSVWTASLYVTLLQFLMMYSIVIFIDIFTDKALLFYVLHGNKTLAIIISLVTMVSLLLVNLYHYRHKYNAIVKKCKNKAANKWFKIWMIAALMMVLLASPVLWNELYKLFVR